MELNLQEALPRFQKSPVMIATPCYGGMCTSAFHTSVVNLTQEFTRAGIPLRQCIVENESLIQRARNNIVHMFLNARLDERPEHRENSPKFEYLLFVDADIQFAVQDVLSLLYFATLDPDKYGVICGSYPKKSINWNIVHMAATSGVPPKDLHNYAENQVMNLVPSEEEKRQIDLSRPVEVLDTGTGFMMIHRSVFEKMEARFPDMRYNPDYALSSQSFDSHLKNGICAFFDCQIVDNEAVKGAGKRYLSEDYLFCKRWRDIGGSVWVCPWINLTHYGTYRYQGNLHATMGLQSAFHEEQMNKKLAEENLKVPVITPEPLNI